MRRDVCLEWVQNEFDKVKCIAAHLSNMNVSPEVAEEVMKVTAQSLLDIP